MRKDTKGARGPAAGSVITYRGEHWRLGAPTVTSDGYVIAWGTLLANGGEPAIDDDGNTIGHSFFLGKAD